MPDRLPPLATPLSLVDDTLTSWHPRSKQSTETVFQVHKTRLTAIGGHSRFCSGRTRDDAQQEYDEDLHRQQCPQVLDNQLAPFQPNNHDVASVAGFEKILRSVSVGEARRLGK